MRYVVYGLSLLGVMMLGGLVWCLVFGPTFEPLLPMADHGTCVESHMVYTPYPSMDGQGNVTISYMWTSECNRHAFPKGDGPRYQAELLIYAADMKAYRVKLAAYNREHGKG